MGSLLSLAAPNTQKERPIVEALTVLAPILVTTQHHHVLLFASSLHDVDDCDVP